MVIKKTFLFTDIRPEAEAEFLDVIGKVLRVFVLAIHCHLLPPPPPMGKIGLKLVCKENVVYERLKSEISQDYAQKPQRNCMLMNSASSTLPCKLQQYYLSHKKEEKN